MPTNLLGMRAGGVIPQQGTATTPAAPNAPGTTFGQLNQITGGALPGITQNATDIIKEMTSPTGGVSPSVTKTANAYFGINSGVPGSEFIRNRGFDLYRQQAQQRQQQGIGDLNSFLGSYGNLVPNPNALLSNQLGYAQLGQSANEFNSSQAFNQWLQQQRLGLDWANLASHFG